MVGCKITSLMARGNQGLMDFSSASKPACCLPRACSVVMAVVGTLKQRSLLEEMPLDRKSQISRNGGP